jgi:predicted TIM-barrel fold metal-dependent hydrolase
MRIIDMEAHFLTQDFAEYLRTLDKTGASNTPEAIARDARFIDLGEQRVGDMVEHGIDAQVLSLYVPGDQTRRVQMFEVKEAVKWAKATNDVLAAACKKYPNRFIGLATIPAQSPEDSAEEIERAVKKLGLKGVNITSHARNEYLDTKKYRIIFQTAAKLDVPVYIHPAFPSSQIAAAFRGYKGVMESATYGFGVEVSIHVLRLIMSGLFDELPNLKMIIGHMGEGLPFWFPRIDRAWTRNSPNRPDLKMRPSDYIKRNFTITTSGMFYTPALMCSYAGMGGDHITLGIDYPIENTGEAIQFMRTAPVCDEDKEKMLHVNAERLFKL